MTETKDPLSELKEIFETALIILKRKTPDDRSPNR